MTPLPRSTRTVVLDELEQRTGRRPDTLEDALAAIGRELGTTGAPALVLLTGRGDVRVEDAPAG